MTKTRFQHYDLAPLAPEPEVTMSRYIAIECDDPYGRTIWRVLDEDGDEHTQFRFLSGAVRWIKNVESGGVATVQWGWK